MTDEEEKKEEEQEAGEDASFDIKKAEEITERLEKANRENKELLLKLQAAKAEMALGGKSEGGMQKEEDEEEKSKKEAMKLLEGTGLNPFE